MKKTILILGLLMLLLVSYNNCNGNGGSFSFPSVKGTEIGNPMGGANLSPQAVQSTEVLDAACVTLVRCNPSLGLETCESGLLGAPNVAPALGLPASTYPTLADIQTAELQGAVTVNSAALTKCTNDLSALTCSDPRVIAAYNGASANAFMNGAQIFQTGPGSCSSLY